jgi:hypothetical protein
VFSTVLGNKLFGFVCLVVAAVCAPLSFLRFSSNTSTLDQWRLLLLIVAVLAFYASRRFYRRAAALDELESMDDRPAVRIRDSS